MMPSLPKIVSQSAVVGLDIGTRVIKAVEMRSGRQGIEILNIGIQPTPLDSIAGGMVMDARSLGAAVRQCLDAAGIKTRRVISSVSGQTSLVVRPIEVPRMSRSELAETMKWEVERHIPFVASEVIMDYQPLIDPEDIPEEQTTMEVLLAVAQEDLINAHLETLRLAKLEPIAIDVEPLAATRATVDMEADQGTYDTTIALVNVGATTTDVSIIRNGLLSMARPVPVAGDNLTRAIAEALGVEEEEAERLKQEHGRVMLDAVAAVAAPPAPVVTEAPPVAAPTVVAPAPRPEDESRVAPAFDLSAELEEERPSLPLPPRRRLPSRRRSRSRSRSPWRAATWRSAYFAPCFRSSPNWCSRFGAPSSIIAAGPRNPASPASCSMAAPRGSKTWSASSAMRSASRWNGPTRCASLTPATSRTTRSIWPPFPACCRSR
jgi:type IV pilus assembly protein PilM